MYTTLIAIGIAPQEIDEIFLFTPKTMLEVGWSYILWSMLYLEGWLSRSSYFIGVALLSLTAKYNFVAKYICRDVDSLHNTSKLLNKESPINHVLHKPVFDPSKFQEWIVLKMYS